MKDNKFSQDDFTRQKQRAEELTKNIEDKIQKAREKQQQELEFQKKNNPEFRDYDEEPIVIRNYEKIFVTHQWIFSFFFSATILLFIMAIYNKHSNTIEILFFLVLIFLEILGLIFLIYRHNKNLKSIIKLKNQYISFCENDKSAKITTFENLSLIISKPFWRHYDNYPISDKIFFGFAVAVLLYMSEMIGIVFFVIFILSNIFFKIIVCLMINKSLEGFRLFPIIVIDKPTHREGFVSSEEYITSGKYYFLYIHSNDDYREIRRYFLYQTGIDIDKIKKEYFN